MSSQLIDQSWFIKPEGVPESESAGGVVARLEDGKIYIAFTKEKKDGNIVLPKGHIENGETVEEAAIREIDEETGLNNLKLITNLGILGRLSFDKREWKTNHFFLFLTTQKEGKPTDPDHPDDALVWHPLDHLPDIFWSDQEKLILDNTDKIKQLILNGK